MKGLSVINSGYIVGELYDHNNYEERIRMHHPIEVKCFSVTSVALEEYGDIIFNFNFDNKSVGLEAALGANVTDDIIEWLESICLGYRDAILVLDAEGPLQMFRLYCQYNENPRFTILTSREYYFDEKKEKFVYNNKTEKEYDKTEDTQIVCDIIVSKRDFVKQLWDATQKALEQTSDKCYEEDWYTNPPVRKSEIIEKFLK